MTISTHTYSAALVGSPDTALSVRGGSLTLDDSAIPHVSGSLDIAVPGAWTTTPAAYSPWVTQATNLAKNPRVGAGGSTAPTGYTADGTVLTISRVDGSAFGTQYAARWTRATTAAGSYRMAAGSSNSTFEVGKTYTVMLSIQSSVAKTYAAFMRPSVASSTNQIALTSIAADAGVVHNIRRTFVATGTSYGLTLTATGAVGETLDATKVAYIEGEYTGPWFDGTTDNQELTQYVWAGTANASSSLTQTRTVTAAGALSWTPNATAWAALDPRLNKRVRVTANGRAFNLGLRDRRVNQADGTISLNLASDEALANDYAPLADDLTPLTMQSSLRQIVNYALGKSIPGAALTTAQSAPDVAIPALADTENLMRNPRAAGNSGGQAWDWQSTWTTGGLTTGIYATGGPSYAPSYWYMGATGGNTTGATHYYTENVLSVSGDQDYVTSVDLRFDAGIQVQVDAVIFDNSGNVIGYATPTIVNGQSGVWQRRKVTFWTPPTAARVRTRVLVLGTLASGKYIDISAWRLSRDTGDPTDIAYFDGTTTNTAQYSFTWAASAHASNTMRKALIDTADPAALTWRQGQTTLEFLAPLVQVAGQRLVNDESRVWTLRNENYSAPGALSIRHGINLISGDDTISRDGGLWFDAAVVRYSWNDSAGTPQTATDAYALTTPYTRLTTIERTGAYPGPGLAQYAVRRAQGRGRELTLTTVSDWTARAEQAITAVLEGAPTQIGKTARVTFSLDNDEMTVTTRTTDTPVGAIDLLPGTIDSLSGSIDSLN